MQRYFVDASAIRNNSVTIIGADHHHIKNVMRFAVGDLIDICPNDASVLHSRITAIDKNTVTAVVIARTIAKKPDVSITIAQALIRKERFELFLEKATELGVAGVIPTRFERSIIQIDDKKASHKSDRYRLIVKEASEQSERSLMPVISDFHDLQNIPFDGYDRVYFASERNLEAIMLRDLIEALPRQGKYLFLIGPEGGISEKEKVYLLGKGAIPVSLGERILRSETAGIMILAAFLSQWGE